jgi:hypothetical protein
MCETLSYIFLYNYDDVQNIYVQIFNQYVGTRNI